MGHRRFLAAAAAVVLATAVAAGADDRERPFPVDRTTILREEKVVYTVTGRQKIPEGVEITCLKDVYVKGVGRDAVLEVEGALKIHGVGTREVIFENVAIELAPKFRDVQMDMAIFRDGAKVRTPPDVAVDGKLFVELVEFEGASNLDVTLSGGSVDLSSVCSEAPIILNAVDPEPGRENRVKVTVRGCQESTEHPGLEGGLLVRGAYDVSVRTNRLGGQRSAFTDCRTLVFDANKVDSTVLEFVQTGDGDFRRSRFTKCDVYASKVSVVSKATEQKTLDRVTIERFWFRGETDLKTLMSKVVRDGTDDPANAARVQIVKPGDRPLELAGAWDR